MPKIGDKSAFAVVFFGLLFCLSAVAAAQVNVQAVVSETNPYKGERIILTIEISGDAFRNIELPRLPELTGLQYLSTSPNTSQRINIVNGVTSRHYSYSYYLQTLDLGKHTIPPIPITIDGKEYKTAPVELNVLDRSAAASRETTDAADDIYLRIEVSDRNPYANQQVQANVVLYFKQSNDVLSYQPNPSWKAEGFWKEELDDGREARTESVLINGVRYRKAVLMQYALFPSKTGRLTISPYTVTCTIRVPPSANSPFAGWGGFGASQRTVDLSSEPVVINVRELPPGAVGSTLGAVGQFDVTRRLSKQNLLVGESVEVITEISGMGNISIASKPEYEFPEGFEVYEPQTQTEVNRRGARINGLKVVRDVLTARRAGLFTVPETTVSWYNDRANRWQQKVLPALTINVEKDPNAVTVVTNTQSSGMNVLPGVITYAAQNAEIAQHLWFWIGLGSPLLVFGVGFAVMRYTTRMNTDTAFARSRKAANQAEAKLSQAAKQAASGDIKGGYGYIHKALAGFIGDRLSLPEAGVDDQVYVDALSKTKAEPAVVAGVEDLLKTCSTIRYAPVTDQITFDSDLKKARHLIGQLRKWI